MALKIKSPGFFTVSTSQIVLIPDGVKWLDTSSVFAHWRRFRFDQIDYVLMSSDHRLTLQAGREYFTIPTRPGKPKHQEFLRELFRCLRPPVAPPA